MTAPLSRGVTQSAMELAKGIFLHADAVTQKFNILGQSGGGKTYTAMKLAELMLAELGRIFVFDLVGVWNGLLSSADGLRAGFPVIVIGGEKGHLPLNATAGRLVADIAIDRDVSVVVDLSQLFAEDEAAVHTFVADCLQQLFKRHQQTKKRRHVFFEEAQELFPQEQPSREQYRLLRVGKTFCKIGRNYGLGYTTISQEPQSVSKRILNQAGTLIAVRTMGELERKAISATARTNEIDLMSELPKLETGDAVIWSPSWLKHVGRVHVLKKVTFDSSRTPDDDEQVVEPKVLATPELEQLRAAMASAIAEAEANDPTALQRRVRQLEAELVSRPPPAPPERVEVPAITDEDRTVLVRLGEHLFAATRALVEIDKRLGTIPGAELRPMPRPHPPDPLNVTLPSPQASVRAQVLGHTPKMEGTGLKKGAREMLRELAALHPKSLTRRELATRSFMSHASGSFGDYLSALRAQELVEDDENGDVRATLVGVKAAGRVVPKSSSELVSTWKGDFKRGAREMLDHLIASRGQYRTREQLAEAAGMAPDGGSVGDYISALVAAGCADAKNPRGGPYTAGHALFMGDR